MEVPSTIPSSLPASSPGSPGSASAAATGGDVQQAAAIPYRLDPEGNLWVMLITNHRGEWIVPKGMIDANRTAEQTALNESLEEAGITGTLDAERLGTFNYTKYGVTLNVAVMGMRVERVLVRWLEQADREREWFGYAEALERLARPDLRRLLRVLHERVTGKSKATAA